MMKMSGRVTTCCVALFLGLTSVSAVHEKLKTISDLREIEFGLSVPKHSLVLLYWFANTVDIDDTDDFIWLTFDPEGDYGAHHYGNYEGLLDPLPPGYRYYTVGNLNHETAVELPPYVVDTPVSEYEGENVDRIIIRVRDQSTGWTERIDRVYITQHENQQRFYDIDHTYQITTDLLRQIREFSVGEDQQQLQRLRHRYGSNADVFNIRSTWGDLAGLGLLLFIVIQEKYSFNRQNYRPKDNNRPQTHSRPETDSRPENNSRPENARPETSSKPENNSRPENDNKPENVRPETSSRPENKSRRKNNNRSGNITSEGEASGTSPLIENTGSDSYDPSGDEPLNDTEALVCCVLFFAFTLYVLLYLLSRFLFG